MRFAFGDNWRSLQSVLWEKRSTKVERALRKSSSSNSLAGLRELDIRLGIGFPSPAMHRLEARASPLDYGAHSAACLAGLCRLFDRRDIEFTFVEGGNSDGH
jgi:hypothetical protein